LYQKKVGIAMGNSLSPVVSKYLWNTVRKQHWTPQTTNPLNGSDNVDNTFVVWPHGAARLQQFLYHLNSLRDTIIFTTEVEANDTLRFLDVLIMKRGPKLATKMYRRLTHTGPGRAPSTIFIFHNDLSFDL
jgi:hypothetical protein